SAELVSLTRARTHAHTHTHTGPLLTCGEALPCPATVVAARPSSPTTTTQCQPPTATTTIPNTNSPTIPTIRQRPILGAFRIPVPLTPACCHHHRLPPPPPHLVT